MADPSLKRLPLSDVIKQGMLALVITAVSSLPAQAASQEKQATETAAASDASAEVVTDEGAIDVGAADAGASEQVVEEEGSEGEVDAAPAAGNITEKDTVIETSANQVDDDDIKKRITGIFSEIEGLKAVNVTVNEGVVSLTGEAPNEKKALQAINLANRVSDVVAVEDRISRTLDVQDNVTPVITQLKQQVRGLIKALPLLLVAIVVFVVVVWFGAWVSRRQSLWKRVAPNPFVAELLSQTIKFVFVIIGLILALSFLGAEAIIGTLLGGAGVIGIAVGFAVKDTIENYIASLMLSIRQPFRARDYVDINGQEGVIVRLTSRATILMTADGNQLRIPNSEVFKATIVNFTKNPERRFTFKLGVDANDDPLAAIKVGLDAINELNFILTDPKAVAIIDEVGDSNIILEFQAWVNQTDTDLLKARSIAIREAKHALENNGFSLPEPIYRMRFNGDLEDAIKDLNKASKTGSESSVEATISAEDTDESTAVSATELKQSQKNVADVLQKEQAKQRARQILGNREVDEVLDTRPDPKLMQKVEEEIMDSAGEEDLLDKNSPQE
ncbi:mechanosensitive ion channel family protein [Psychrobacter sanguinis]|uniref:mechanosensitive ion channel family protein n=1 Tax=Psychrobacter sanguinis TaxID=861445 RepID=UPI00020C9434|nr:mechanosensitive ion channel family protein [Psychrobacter sanguinis]EGK13330.1 small-conductance mechanosensitive ion channel MscS [Psychrobacter sp. 1501(2011)]MCC3308950.1 mechanosensitive ion channel [Psychrobacter sanguinis]MCD9150342.1 mechanosensitive ion channel [Psychrobacter sanguinis]UEC26241.1 mechanosensitive ion channel [Psychrobacter sanguinis]